MIAVIVGLLCLILVPASGGKWRRLASTRLPNEGMVIFLFLAQGVLRGGLSFAESRLAGSLVVIGWAAACLALIVLLRRAWGVPGIGLIGLGIALNLAVVLLNEGMPYQAIGGAPVDSAIAFYRAGTRGTTLLFLGDVLPDPTSAYLLSLGDMLLAIGATTFVVASSIAEPRVPRSRSMRQQVG